MKYVIHHCPFDWFMQMLSSALLIRAAVSGKTCVCVCVCVWACMNNLTPGCLLWLSTIRMCVFRWYLLKEKQTHIGVCVIKFTTEGIFTDVQIFTLQGLRQLHGLTLSWLHEQRVKKQDVDPEYTKQTNQKHVSLSHTRKVFKAAASFLKEFNFPNLSYNKSGIWLIQFNVSGF